MIVKLFPMPVVPSGSWASISTANPIIVVVTWAYTDSVASEAALQSLYQILING